MFIEPEELNTVVYKSQLMGITTDEAIVRQAILAAIDEARGYLAVRYDTNKIFAAQGDERNVILLEHCKGMALWYLVRLSNADIIYDRVKDYYKQAVDWLRLAAGIGEGGKGIAPDLPLIKDEDGETKIPMRAGSNPKFTHSF